ncbi:hypothetical protein ACHQM5_015666 [Ranunculus cassubicifolius]
MNYAYMSDNPPKRLQAMIAKKDFSNPASSLHASPWILDTGATNHVTSNMSNISDYSTYYGNDKLAVGNGHTLPIHNTGQHYEQDPYERFT